MSNINWKTEGNDAHLIGDIVERYRKVLTEKIYEDCDTLQVRMSLTACHLNDVPLDLEGLLNEADDFNLIHDVSGIHGHICTVTGKLKNCFLPRFSKRVEV